MEHESRNIGAEYVAGIADAYMGATAEDVANGRAWYPAAARMARGIARRERVPMAAVAVAIAALSPRNPWRWNIADAAAMARWHAQGRVYARPTVTTFTSNADRAADALEHGGRTWRSTAPKVRSFVANILGDVDAVTVDVHATRAATFGEQDVPRTDREYQAIAAAYRTVAELVGETPRDLQAIVWLVAIRKYGRVPRQHACKRGTFDYVRQYFGEAVAA